MPSTTRPKWIDHLPSLLTDGVESGPSNEDAWEARTREFVAISSYEDDWDGQGAEKPSPKVLETARELLDGLRSVRVSPPYGIFPGVNGTVKFAWDGPSGERIHLEVIESNEVEVFVVRRDETSDLWIFRVEEV